MELTGIFTDLVRLVAGRNGRSDGKKTSSCKKYNRSLNNLARNYLCVVHFVVGVLMFCGNRSLEVSGRDLHAILLVSITLLWLSVLNHLRGRAQGSRWRGYLCPWVNQSGNGMPGLDCSFLAGTSKRRVG